MNLGPKSFTWSLSLDSPERWATLSRDSGPLPALRRWVKWLWTLQPSLGPIISAYFQSQDVDESAVRKQGAEDKEEGSPKGLRDTLLRFPSLSRL